MHGTSRLSPEEITRLFSQINEAGIVDIKRGNAQATPQRAIDPLSLTDPSGSTAGRAISRTALAVIVLVLFFVLVLQIGYGVGRRLSTANLSESASKINVEHALATGVEWGNGFTQFPAWSHVDEADEAAGLIKVSVTDTSSKNELELLSSTQVQSTALATNALLNEKIQRVVYNVYAITDRKGNIQHNKFFGFIPAQGTRRAILTYVWTKEVSEHSNYIDWKLKIIGMDDKVARKIQNQVNSVSSLIEADAINQKVFNQQQEERTREQLLHGIEIFKGGHAQKQPRDARDKSASKAR
ncbi:hypothetical protein KPC83_00125 [Collinsella sp. zg1085]|uniref:hypothetical protein n=1 Tax=Collinsella sp. zg1085 TaxID=2844380 RepID=UPI001C0DE9B3|nr:hypothetical protein [Collinsella sp. zg1085]QWT17622.1 hypothetical protein KPC83_00125 [Collinsella sp. zg1085]